MTRRPMGTKDSWRRPCVTTDTQWQGNPIKVSVGLYLDGTPGEVFADASYRVQPLVHGTLSDACVGISISLQHGITPDDLAKSLGTVPFWELVGGEMVMVDAPASPIGTIIAEIRKAADHG